MTVINTNISATLTANALTKNERAMGQTMEQVNEIAARASQQKARVSLGI